MSKIRTFIAVEATSNVRARAVQLIDALAPTPANVKWVDERNLHWTLKFLGEVDSNDVPDICQAAADAVEQFEPFDVDAVGAGAFPSSSRPRTVWLGVTRGEPQFVALHGALEKTLAKLGFRREHRRFQPHMTLGRVRRSPQGVHELGEKIKEQTDFDAGTMKVREVVVLSSELDRAGPHYQALGRIALQG